MNNFSARSLSRAHRRTFDSLDFVACFLAGLSDLRVKGIDAARPFSDGIPGDAADT
jgi:hypothetical protein